MTPEQRAAKIVSDWITPNAAIQPGLTRDITRALRAERNAALEEAAWLAYNEYQHQLQHRGQHVAFIMEPVAEAIRSLKRRAPRARRKS